MNRRTFLRRAMAAMGTAVLPASIWVPTKTISVPTVASPPRSEYIGCLMVMMTGSCAGEVREVVDSWHSGLTVNAPWSTYPSDNDRYMLVGASPLGAPHYDCAFIHSKFGKLPTVPNIRGYGS